MPWQETATVDQRRESCELAAQEGSNVRALCRGFGVSPKTGDTWLRRDRAEGPAGLRDRSRRPHTSPARTPPAVEARVLAARDAHPAWGGRTLRREVRRQGRGPVPAASTITAILRRHDRLGTTDGAAPRPWQRFERAAPNDRWPLDFKGPLALADGRCHPLLVVDDHSRYLLGVEACPDQTWRTVQAALTALFRRYGLPWCLLADPGPPWGAPQGGPVLAACDLWLLRLGVELWHGRPHHPQTQGKVERLSLTLEREVLRDHAYRDPPAVQAAFATWRDGYRRRRPHEALADHPPITRYRRRRRPFPEPLPPVTYGPEYDVRTVAAGGQIRYRGRLYCLSQALGGERVGLRPPRTDGVVAVHHAHRCPGLPDLAAPDHGFRLGPTDATVEV